MMQNPTDLKGHVTPAQTVCYGSSLNFDLRPKPFAATSSKKFLLQGPRDRETHTAVNVRNPKPLQLQQKQVNAKRLAHVALRKSELAH